MRRFRMIGMCLLLAVDAGCARKAEREIPGNAAAVLERSAAVDSAALRTVPPAVLARAGRVWGFVKYHHPAVARGGYDMDLELMGILQQLTAANAPPVDSVLAQWIRHLGPLPANSHPRALPARLHFAADTGWIHDRTRTLPSLAVALENVYAARPAGDHVYVGFVPNVGNPVFDAERPYETTGPPGAPGAAMQLLGLFRFWNIVEYYFPYRDVIGTDWYPVLEEFVPKFVTAGTQAEYARAAIALAARVHDTHCNVWNRLALRPPAGACAAPARVRFVENVPVVWAVRDSAPPPLQPGDVVTHVDGRPVAELLAEWAPFYPASNPPTRLRDLGGGLLRGPCMPLLARIERNGLPMEIALERQPEKGPRPYHFDRGPDALQLLSPDVAYLSIGHVKTADVRSYLERIQGTKALVIDIRNYPSDFVVFALGQHLFGERTEFVRFTQASPGNPGAFEWTPPLSIRPRAPHYGGKIVILVDETTQSSAEYHAMAFRAVPGAIVVGSTTAGADGNISPITLPGGLRTMISGIGVFYPDQRPTQRVGIVPDIVSVPTLAGIRSGRDEVLERGLAAAAGAEEARRILDANR